MNKKTLLFLDALAERFRKDDLNQLACHHLQKLFADTLSPCWPTRQVIWLTVDAKSLKADLEACWQQINRLRQPADGIPLLTQIQQLHSRWLVLDQQTQQQMYANGSVDCSRLHVVQRREENPFRTWFLELCQIQLYRLLTLGGTNAFRRMAVLEDESVEGLTSYYQKQILPALATLSRTELSSLWSVQWSEQMGLGGYLLLPGCQASFPRNSVCDLLPGRYRLVDSDDHYRIYEGRGLLTNISPKTILEAQRSGFRGEGELSVADLMWLTPDDLDKSPAVLLEHCTHGQLYAVDAYDYFSKFGFVCGLLQLQQRHQAQQCPLCGATLGRKEQICSACKNRMAQI